MFVWFKMSLTLRKSVFKWEKDHRVVEGGVVGVAGNAAAVEGQHGVDLVSANHLDEEKNSENQIEMVNQHTSCRIKEKFADISEF